MSRPSGGGSHAGVVDVRGTAQAVARESDALRVGSYTGRRHAPSDEREVLSGGDALHPVRRGSGLSVSLGGGVPGPRNVRVPGNGAVHGRDPGGRLLYLETRRPLLAPERGSSAS